MILLYSTKSNPNKCECDANAMRQPTVQSIPVMSSDGPHRVRASTLWPPDWRLQFHLLCFRVRTGPGSRGQTRSAHWCRGVCATLSDSVTANTEKTKKSNGLVTARQTDTQPNAILPNDTEPIDNDEPNATMTNVIVLFYMQ